MLVLGGTNYLTDAQPAPSLSGSDRGAASERLGAA